MRRLVPLALLLLLSLSSRTALADDGDGGETWIGPLVAVTIVAPIDLGLAIHDVAVHDSSRTYGVVETLLVAPQVAATATLMVQTLSGDGPGNEKVGSVVIFAATAALLAHAVHEWVEDDSPPDQPRVLPTALGDAAHPGAGLALVGRW